MSGGKARDYDEFEELKIESCININEYNAAQELGSLKIQLLTVLQNLNVDNITEVEDLYLMVAQLTLAATYVAAQTKAARKNISFEDALDGIGGEDSVSVLEETFASQPEIEHFFKFITIDEQYRPTKEAWAGLHAKMAFIVSISVQN